MDIWILQPRRMPERQQFHLRSARSTAPTQAPYEPAAIGKQQYVPKVYQTANRVPQAYLTTMPVWEPVRFQVYETHQNPAATKQSKIPHSHISKKMLNNDNDAKQHKSLLMPSATNCGARNIPPASCRQTTFPSMAHTSCAKNHIPSRVARCRGAPMLQGSLPR